MIKIIFWLKLILLMAVLKTCLFINQYLVRFRQKETCLFGLTNIVKNSDKAKWYYSRYGIAFVRVGLCSFGNGFSRNLITFGVDDSSLSQVDNHKINLQCQVKVPLVI